MAFKSEEALFDREIDIFADISKGVLEHPEFAVSLAKSNYDNSSTNAINAGRLYGFESDLYDELNRESHTHDLARSTINRILNGEEVMAHEIKNLVRSDVGLEIAKQVANEDFTEVAYNNHMDAQNKSLLSQFKQYVSELPESAIAIANKEISVAESVFGNVSQQANKAKSAKSAIENILKGVKPSPSDTKALLESSSFVDILQNGKQLAEQMHERETAILKENPSTTKEPSHSKLFELSDIPNKEIMDARTHYGTGVSEYAARANGGPYKGEILETDSHLVQLVSSKSIVFHRKSDVTLPDGLQKVNGQELSIYYKEGSAKAYRLDPVKDQLDRTVASLDRAAKGMGLPEVFGEQLAQAHKEAWKGIQAARNSIRESKEPTQEQDAPKRSPSR